jgi:hypothetical protein
MASMMEGRGLVVAVDHLSAPYTGEAARNEIIRSVGSLRIVSVFMENLDQELREHRVYGVFLDGDAAREAVKDFLGHRQTVDFCWLDGDHAYQDVIADIRAYLPLMRPGAIFAGHDYEPAFPDVVRAVNEIFPGFERGPGTAWFYRVPDGGRPQWSIHTSGP